MLKVILSTDCIKFPLTGIGRYAYELAQQLQSHNEIADLIFLNGLRVTNILPVASDVGRTTEGLKRKLQKSKLVSDIYRLTYPYLKSRSIKKHKDWVFHSPNYYIPPNTPNAVATFHDLSVFHWPEFHPKGRVHLMQKELAQTIKRAKMLLTDSEYTRLELAEYFDLDVGRIITAPLASSGQFFPQDPTKIQAVLDRFGLKQKKYLLYTGTIEPRKNVITLLQAYEQLSLEDKRNFPLVISGYKGWENDVLLTLFDKGKREGWLKYLGFTSSHDLPYLFSGAKAFIFPSIYEGFGLPVLEAMASGTPVICSDATSLPEVVGEAALLSPPKDVDTFTSHMHRVINDCSLEESMISSGFIQADKFSWQHCAEKTVEAYKKAVE
jgi:alpha-1,3-rhamnosyl/mannosyltransferase